MTAEEAQLSSAFDALTRLSAENEEKLRAEFAEAYGVGGRPVSTGKMKVAFYSTTDAFRSIHQHVAVTREDGSLLAVTGQSTGKGAMESIELAELFAEAGTVSAETGRTPRQLADERAELLTALRGIIGLERRKLLKDKAAKAWVGAALDAIAKVEGKR